MAKILIADLIDSNDGLRAYKKGDDVSGVSAKSLEFLTKGGYLEGSKKSESDEEDVKDYITWTKALLVAELEKRELEFDPSSKKDVLVELLETNDSEQG